jgi:hypothetical protein
MPDLCQVKGGVNRYRKGIECSTGMRVANQTVA